MPDDPSDRDRPTRVDRPLALAPAIGSAIFLVATAATQSLDAGGWALAGAVAVTVAGVAAAVAILSARTQSPRRMSATALVLAGVGLISVPTLSWLGVAEVLGAAAVGLALESRAVRGSWPTTAVIATLLGTVAVAAGALVLWVW